MMTKNLGSNNIPSIDLHIYSIASWVHQSCGRAAVTNRSFLQPKDIAENINISIKIVPSPSGFV